MSQIQDTSAPIEPFLKSLLSSLDLQYATQTLLYPNVEAYATQFAKQLKPSSAIIVNGRPVVATNNDAKIEFQKKWLAVPQTSHQLTSFDCQLIPGSGVYVINLSGKLRFDESGKTRLGETADLVGDSISKPTRPIWGSWFGFNLNLVVDEIIAANSDAEAINCFDFRLTHVPDDSIIQVF